MNKKRDTSNSAKELGRDVLSVLKDLLTQEDLEKLKQGLRNRIAHFKNIRNLSPGDAKTAKARRAAEEYGKTKDLINISNKYHISVKTILEEWNKMNVKCMARDNPSPNPPESADADCDGPDTGAHCSGSN